MYPSTKNGFQDTCPGLEFFSTVGVRCTVRTLSAGVAESSATPAGVDGN
jgi:hypothetical protein